MRLGDQDPLVLVDTDTCADITHSTVLLLIWLRALDQAQLGSHRLLTLTSQALCASPSRFPWFVTAFKAGNLQGRAISSAPQGTGPLCFPPHSTPSRACPGAGSENTPVTREASGPGKLGWTALRDTQGRSTVHPVCPRREMREQACWATHLRVRDGKQLGWGRQAQFTEATMRLTSSSFYSWHLDT